MSSAPEFDPAVVERMAAAIRLTASGGEVVLLYGQLPSWDQEPWRRSAREALAGFHSHGLTVSLTDDGK